MSFVKLHSDTLKSTIWKDPAAFRIFVAAMMSSRPTTFEQPQPILEVDSLEETGLAVPAGAYGFARVSGPWLVEQARCRDESEAWDALRRLCGPESESKSEILGGRRLARINGGYVVVNYMKYRENDSTAAARQRRLRERNAKKQKAYRDRQRASRARRAGVTGAVTGGAGNAPVTPGNAPVTSRLRHSNEPAGDTTQVVQSNGLPERTASRRDTIVTGRDSRDTRLRPVTPGNATFRDRSQVDENAGGYDDPLNQQEAEAEADPTTTDNEPPPRALRASAGTWSEEACDDWNDRFGNGTAPGGRIGQGLKLIVDKYGWDAIRPAWRYYLGQKEPQFASPQDFASKLKIWLDRKTAGPGRTAAMHERSRAAILEWLHGEGE